MDNINVQNNHVYLPQDPSLTEGINWTPNEGVSVSGTDYGQIQNVTVTDDQITVETTYGLLEFSGVALDEASGDFSNADQVQRRLAELSSNVFSFLELEMLYVDTQQQRKENERMLRHLARDQQECNALRAADEIRDGALANLIFGCCAGGLNILMSTISLKMSMSALSQTKPAAQEVRMAKTEARMARTESQLRQVDVEIAETQQKLDANPPFEEQMELKANLQKLETRRAELVELKTQQKTQLDARVEKAEAQVAEAEATLAKRMEAANDPNAKTPQWFRDARLKAAQQNYDMAVAKRDSLVATQTQANQFSETPTLDEVKSADVAELQQKADAAQQWQDQSKARLDAAYSKLNTQLGNVQNLTALANALTQMGSAGAQILQSIGGYLEALGQAASKELDAQAEQDKAAADDATSDMQSSQECIDAAKKLWEDIRQSWLQSFRMINA